MSGQYGGGGGGLSTNPYSAPTIPGLAASPDASHGGVNDTDFNAAGSWVTFNAPSAADIAVTVPSHAYVKQTDTVGTNKLTGYLLAAPAIPYTVTCKLTDAAFNPVTNSRACLFVLDGNVSGKALALGLETNANPYNLNATTWTDWATFSGGLNSSRQIGNIGGPLYLRCVVNAANSIDCYYSTGGRTFTPLTTAVNFLANATYVGVGVLTFQGAVYALFDWVSFTTPSGDNHTFLL